MTDVRIELDLNLDLTNTWTGSTDHTTQYKLVVEAEVKNDDQNAMDAIDEFRHQCSVMNWSNVTHASRIGTGFWSKATWINRGSRHESLHTLVDRNGNQYKVEPVVEGLYEVIDAPWSSGYIVSEMYQDNLFGLRAMLIVLARTVMHKTHWPKRISLTDVEAGVTITTSNDE